MILRSVEVESFGKFNAVNFEFRRGMNLVTGPNEAGKSTLAELIPATLFGTKQVDRFKPWGRSGCSTSLVFEGDGKTFEIKRNLITDDVQVVEKDSLYQSEPRFQGKAPLNGRSPSCREYRLLLEELLGISDDDLFRATCMFGQTVAEWTGDALGEKLRRLISGRDEADFTEILDDLLEEHFALTRENPWGRDKQRDRQIELIRQELAKLAEGAPATFTMAADDEAPGAAERMRALSAELEHDRSEYVKGVCYVEKLRQSLKETASAGQTSEGESPAEAAEEAAEESAVPAQPADSSPVEDLRSRLDAAGLPENLPENLPDLLSEASRIRQELAEFQLPLAALAKSEAKVRKTPWKLGVGLTVVLAGLAAAAWFFSLQAVVVSAVCAFALTAGWGWCLWCGVQARREREDLTQQKRKLEQSKAAVLTRQAELSERCEALGLPSTAIGLVRLQQVVERNRALLDQWWSSSKDLPAVDAPPSAEPVKQAPASPAPDEQDREAAAELAELEQRLADFAAKLKTKEQELARLQARSARTSGDAAATDASPGAALQQKYQQLQQRVLVLRTAVDLLVSGVEDYRQSHLAGLTQEAGRLFAKMTGGRYASIRLDEDMRPEIRVDERRWHPADHFSRGTRDALYLALRIALARVRGEDDSLPLLLDDPFVHLDRERLSSTLKLLDMAAAGGQLILLSHNEDLARRAARERWHVISLGDRSTGADNADGDKHAGQLHLL